MPTRCWHAAAGLDARGRALLEEDLRSPCTEEIAVFRAFARVVAEGEHGFVVLDTAPTGHTLLLLDAAEAYHREVERTQGTLPESVRQLLPRLRDPAFTRVLLVTLPEATPVHEATALQDDLRAPASNRSPGSSTRALPPSTRTTPCSARAAPVRTATWPKSGSSSRDWSPSPLGSDPPRRPVRSSRLHRRVGVGRQQTPVSLHR